jgi:hypothetical protein
MLLQICCRSSRRQQSIQLMIAGLGNRQRRLGGHDAARDCFVAALLAMTALSLRAKRSNLVEHVFLTAHGLDSRRIAA